MSPAEFYAQELHNYRKRFEAGHLPALHETVRMCGVWEIPLPDWATAALVRLLSEHYFHAPSRGARGKPSPKRRYTRDYLDWLCWLKFEGACRLNFFDPDRKAPGGRPKPGEITKKALLEETRKMLRGTPASSRNTRQILQCWRKVRDAKKAGDERYRSFE